MKNTILSLALAVGLTSLAGCTTVSKVTRIDPGMTRAQVSSTIGRPYKKASCTDSKGNLIETWSYQETTWDDGGWSWNRTIVRSDVTFVNGIVSNIGTGADRYLHDNPVLPAVYALQNQQAINAYNNRTQVLAQPVDVRVKSTVDQNINANVQIHEY